MHIHFISRTEINKLEELFAFLTIDGWKLPQWIIDLQNTCTIEK